MTALDLNFALPAYVNELAARVKTFVQEQVIPYEKDPRWTSHGPTDELRRELNALADRAGVLAPHADSTAARGAGISQSIRSLRPGLRQVGVDYAR